MLPAKRDKVVVTWRYPPLAGPPKPISRAHCMPNRKIRGPNLLKNPRPGHAESVTRPMLNLPAEGARILPSHPSKTVGGSHASLRIFVPRLPEILPQNSSPPSLQRGPILIPALRRTGGRAALRFHPPHIKPERTTPTPRSWRIHSDNLACG